MRESEIASPVAVQMNLDLTMNLDADDVVETFKKFKQKIPERFNCRRKVSYILLWMGEKGLDLFNSWDMSESDFSNPDTLLEKCERYQEPRSNHRIHRYEFQGLKQDPQETINNFLSRLKNVAEKCRFKDKDERIVDQLIWGCAHKEVQKSLIGKDALQLIEAVDTARVFEAITKQMTSPFKQKQ
uniref:Retrotransposon gag domain-containing protein n=1 Tax=Octopus bimaculoides TaxID=37653 RepID=A0A0L8H969_OCTBM